MPTHTYIEKQSQFIVKRPENWQGQFKQSSPNLPAKTEVTSQPKTPQHQKEVQRKLSRLQKNAPRTAVSLTKRKERTVVKFIAGLFRQIDWSIDWLFLFLFSFGLLKDIIDVAFAAAGAIPVIGTAGTAIGIIVSFVGDLMFLILVITVLILVGSSFKNRGLAKYFFNTAMEFIAEALPGISWLPWTVIYVFILYLCVLYDRTANEEERKEARIY